MNSLEIFQLALNLSSPWTVGEVEFLEGKEGKQELHIRIDFDKEYTFENGSRYYDSRDRTWRHLNFFEHECYIHCNVPRIKSNEGKVTTLATPWARTGSGFTLLFEAYSMALIEKEMPVNQVADLIKVYAQRIWTIFNYWISRAYNDADHSEVTKLSIDETSTKKGHDYITLAVDLEKRRVIHATEGKGKDTIKDIAEYLESKGVGCDEITDASIDMSPSFIAGILDYFPNAAITFDRFHVVKLLNDAMDKVRKSEAKEHDLLKKQKYTFLKSNKNLSPRQKEERENLIDLLPTIGRAYQLKILFNDFWEFEDREEAEAFLQYWCDLVEEEVGLYPFKEFVKTVKSHWKGLCNYIETKIANGIIEGINSKIQLAKRRARGYRNITNFINMVYFISGKLKFDYPLYST